MHSSPNDEISLTIHCLYDLQQEAVGIDAMPSPAFERAEQPRAMVEILAAINAKSNALATAVIRDYTEDADRRRELFDHFAGLKEHMLNDLLEQMN